MTLGRMFNKVLCEIRKDQGNGKNRKRAPEFFVIRIDVQNIAKQAVNLRAANDLREHSLDA
jgi:hypothetical protein